MEKAAIGAAGELLVQYKLLKCGIHSARLTVDDGIDLVMYLGKHSGPATVQVKTKLKPVPAGGKGKPTLGWFFPHACPAEWLAVADLSTDSAWLFTMDKAKELAQQHSPKDQRQLYWYIGEPAPKRALVQKGMEQYRIEQVAQQLLVDASTLPLPEHLSIG